ncbi:MAG: radical SAM protein [Caldilineaceae bacterium]|nr:radical SAM protein [Caldilineaceae bacterium]
MAISVDQQPRPASGALTKTGGFLAGFTHTLQPYIGCRFGCEYCYVKGLSVHRFHQPAAAWGSYVPPRTGIAEKLRNELRRLEEKGELATTAIFMSSATDPYQGIERKWRLSRACLDALIERPPGLLVIQTRSPLIEDEFDRIAALGNRCWLNVTLETDRDDVRHALTPLCPSIDRRLITLRRALAADLQVQITVSPLLPYSSAPVFGNLLIAHSKRVIVDTYTSGDGQQGKRTAATAIPALYEQHGLGNWRAETAAEALFQWLHTAIGDRVGWSQAGFATLAQLVTGIGTNLS